MKRFIAIVLALVLCLSIAVAAFADKSDIKAITIDGSFFEGMTEEEMSITAKQNGYSYEINDDSTVSLTMPLDVYESLMEETRNSVESSFQDLIDDENTSFVKIEHNDDFSEIVVYNDAEKYNFFMSIYSLQFYMLGGYYQQFLGTDANDIDVVVKYVDNKDGSILDTASYKDFIKATEQEPENEAVLTIDEDSDEMLISAEGYTIEILAAHPFIGGDNLAYAEVELKFTNSNPEATQLAFASSIRAYQNGVSPSRSNMWLNQDYDWDARNSSVKDGGTITAFVPVPLENTSDPIELEVSIIKNFMSVKTESYKIELQ